MRYIFTKITIALLFLTITTINTAARIKYTTATRIGMISDNKNEALNNYYKLRDAVLKKKNINLDGSFFITFPEQISLNYPLHITNGELNILRGNGFDFENGGGFHAHNVCFNRIDTEEGSSLCGNWRKHSAIQIEGIEFDNCIYRGRHLVRLEFEDINGLEHPYGIEYINIHNSKFEHGSAITLLDAIIKKNCLFEDNIYSKFPITPIYIAYHHSKSGNPDEEGTYEYPSINNRLSCPVKIINNKFYGMTVSYNYYYCTALVVAPVCYYKNNLIKNLVNYSDGSSDMSSATCYDAYLSCREVYFENNNVEGLISYSKNGAHKPQCEIGKSKNAVSRVDGKKSVRHYINNTYILDCTKLLEGGADRNSLYTNIMGNVDYIDEYIWRGNTINYINADLAGRTSSEGYGSFIFDHNNITADNIQNYGICMVSSGKDLKSVEITNNIFSLKTGKPFYLFNQIYDTSYASHNRGNITIRGNKFTNCSPVNSFFYANKIDINDNVFDSVMPNESYCVSDYAGRQIYTDVLEMKVQLPYATKKNGKSRLSMNLSNHARGVVSIPLSNPSSSNIILGKYKWDKDVSFSFDFEYKSNKEAFLNNFVVSTKGDNVVITDGKKQFNIKNSWVTLFYHNGVYFTVRQDPTDRTLIYYIYGPSATQESISTILTYKG